jgi:hypothetical protein
MASQGDKTEFSTAPAGSERSTLAGVRLGDEWEDDNQSQPPTDRLEEIAGEFLETVGERGYVSPRRGVSRARLDVIPERGEGELAESIAEAGIREITGRWFGSLSHIIEQALETSLAPIIARLTRVEGLGGDQERIRADLVQARGDIRMLQAGIQAAVASVEGLRREVHRLGQENVRLAARVRQPVPEGAAPPTELLLPAPGRDIPRIRRRNED